MTTLKLTPDQELFLKSMSSSVEGKYHFLPYWFKELSNGEYEVMPLDKLPAYFVELLKKSREVLKSKYKFNPNDKRWYVNRENEERTRTRLTEMAEEGMEIVGEAQWGIENIMSGLYIEKVWDYNDEQWKGYMDWVREIKNRKS